MHTRDRVVGDVEFVQRVRKYRPGSLLPLIAATSARYKEELWWRPVRPKFPSYRPYRPWALAEVARVSLAHGSEFQRKDATPQDLERLLNLHSRLSDPFVHNDARSDPDALWSFLLRITNEQFPYQRPLRPDLARTAAVLTFTEPNKALTALADGWEQELLGCSLSEYVGITLVLHAAVQEFGGRVDLASFARPEHRFITDVLPADLINHVAEQHFVTDQARFKAANTRITTGPDLRRFEYNPLRSTPLVAGYGPGLIAPCSHLVAPKASLLNLYDLGGRHFGKAFRRDLGTLFEQYVGRQLQLIPNAQVHPEILYGPRKARIHSADWIVVFDDLVLIVEVKSTRPDAEVRLGTEDKIKLLEERLTKGYTKIDETAACIRSRAAEFRAIPADRPIHGLLITMEPFDMANAPFQRQYQPQTDTFVTVASAGELEQLVVVVDGLPNEVLLARAADPERSTYSLGEALRERALGANPVLDEAWASYSWSDILASGGPGAAASGPAIDAEGKG